MIKVKITDLAKYYGLSKRTVQYACEEYGNLKGMDFDNLRDLLVKLEKKRKN
jgi:hypothetical protein